MQGNVHRKHWNWRRPDRLIRGMRIKAFVVESLRYIFSLFPAIKVDPVSYGMCTLHRFGFFFGTGKIRGDQPSWFRFVRFGSIVQPPWITCRWPSLRQTFPRLWEVRLGSTYCLGFHYGRECWLLGMLQYTCAWEGCLAACQSTNYTNAVFTELV